MPNLAQLSMDGSTDWEWNLGRQGPFQNMGPVRHQWAGSGLSGLDDVESETVGLLRATANETRRSFGGHRCCPDNGLIGPRKTNFGATIRVSLAILGIHPSSANHQTRQAPYFCHNSPAGTHNPYSQTRNTIAVVCIDHLRQAHTQAARPAYRSARINP